MTGVDELMEDVDPEVRADPLVFPDEQTLSRAKVFKGLTEEEETRCNRAFAALTGA